MSEWFYRLQGEEFGPVSREFLDSMIGDMLDETDEVREGATGSWIRVSDIGNQAPAGIAAPVAGPANNRNHSTEYYFEIFGQEMGPHSIEDARQLVSEGTVPDRVKKGTGPWLPIGQVIELRHLVPSEPIAPAVQRSTSAVDRMANSASAEPATAQTDAQEDSPPQENTSADSLQSTVETSTSIPIESDTEIPKTRVKSKTKKRRRPSSKKADHQRRKEKATISDDAVQDILNADANEANSSSPTSDSTGEPMQATPVEQSNAAEQPTTGTTAEHVELKNDQTEQRLQETPQQTEAPGSTTANPVETSANASTPVPASTPITASTPPPPSSSPAPRPPMPAIAKPKRSLSLPSISFNPRIVAAVAGAAVLAALVYFGMGLLSGGGRKTIDVDAPQFYSQLKGVLDKVRSMRKDGVGTDRWTRYRDQALSVRSLIQEACRQSGIDKEGSNEGQACAEMLRISKEYLPGMLSKSRNEESEEEKKFEEGLNKVGSLLN